MGFFGAMGKALKAPAKLVSKAPGMNAVTKPLNTMAKAVPGGRATMGAMGMKPPSAPQGAGVGPSPGGLQNMAQAAGNVASAFRPIGQMQPGFQKPQLPPMQPPPMTPAPQTNVSMPQEPGPDQDQAIRNQFNLQQQMQQEAPRPDVMPQMGGEVPLAGPQQAMGQMGQAFGQGIGPRAPMINQMARRPGFGGFVNRRPMY